MTTTLLILAAIVFMAYRTMPIFFKSWRVVDKPEYGRIDFYLVQRFHSIDNPYGRGRIDTGIGVKVHSSTFEEDMKEARRLAHEKCDTLTRKKRLIRKRK